MKQEEENANTMFKHKSSAKSKSGQSFMSKDEMEAKLAQTLKHNTMLENESVTMCARLNEQLLKVSKENVKLKQSIAAELDDQIECEAHAVTPLCAWDGYVCEVKGYKAPCDKYWSSDGCQKNGCTWNRLASSCDETGGEVPCEQFTTDECGTGASTHCAVIHQECEHKTSLDPATVPPLDGKGDGRGNEYYGKCTSTLWGQVKEKIENDDDIRPCV